MLIAIQVLRGFAALIVALFHLPWLRYRDAHPGSPSFATGAAGVDLFFVLSGAVMMLASQDAAGLRDAGKFWMRRAIRVLPPYWAVTAVATLQFRADYAGTPWQAVEWTAVLSSLFLLPIPLRGDPDDIMPLVPQGWTLEYEVFFYFVFGLALVAAPRRKALVLGAALALLCLAGARFDLPGFLRIYAKSETLEFVSGMAVGRAYLDGRRMGGAAAAGCVALGGMAILAAPHWIDPTRAWRGLCWGLPSALVVAGLLCGPAWRDTPLLRPLVALGDASYTLYLIHDLVYQLWFYAFTGARGDVTLRPRWFAPMLLSAVALSFPVYALIERPMTRWLQGALLGAGRGAPFRLPRASAEISTPAPVEGER